MGVNQPSALTCKSARLEGWVNPHGGATAFHFEYWQQGVNITHTTGAGHAGPGKDRTSVSRVADNLQANTGYSAKLVASNAAGRSVSDVVSFMTRKRC